MNCLAKTLSSRTHSRGCFCAWRRRDHSLEREEIDPRTMLCGSNVHIYVSMKLGIYIPTAISENQVAVFFNKSY
jgi:hypothetical protein